MIGRRSTRWPTRPPKRRPRLERPERAIGAKADVLGRLKPVERPRDLIAIKPAIDAERESPPTQALDLDSALAMHRFSLQSQGASHHTIRMYTRVEGDFISFLRLEWPVSALPIALLSVENIRIWLQRLQVRKLQGSSIQTYATILKTWARFLTLEEFFARDPLARLKVQRAHPKVIKTFTAEQLQAMIRVASIGVAGGVGAIASRNVAVLFFLIATGVRAAELCHLKVEDVDIQHGAARVVGKGNKERRVHFDPATSKMLIRYLASRKSEEPWLFLSREGRKWTTSGLAYMVREVGTAAGITGVRVSPHTFRHTFGVSYSRAHPGAAFQLQDLMGHADAQTTRRYVRFSETEAELPGPSVVSLLGLDRLARGRLS
jgi:integrase/recombinase XerC